MNDPRAQAKKAEPGPGFGMDYSVTPPEDKTGWQQCPKCEMWIKGTNLAACPHCGVALSTKAAHEHLENNPQVYQAARQLVEVAGSNDKAMLALESLAAVARDREGESP